jgi:hypothetical protein
MSKIYIYAAVVVGAILVVVWNFKNSGRPKITEVGAVSVEAATPLRPSFSAVKEVASSTNARVPQVQGSPFRRQFEQANNMSALIQAGLSDPTHGGHLYAALAYFQCSRLRSVQVPSEVSTNPIQESARKDLFAEKNKCDGVMDSYDGVTISRQIKDTRLGLDPYMPKESRGLMSAASPPYALDDFASALASHDPYAISVVLQSNIDSLMTNWTGRQIPEGDTQFVYNAAEYVGCEVRDDCTKSATSTLLCALDNECKSRDLRELLSAGYSDEQRQKLEEYIAIVRSHLVG